MQFKTDYSLWGERYYTTQLALNLFKSYGLTSIVQVGGQVRDFEYSPIDFYSVLGEFIEDIEMGTYELYLDTNNISQSRLNNIKSTLYKNYDINKVSISTDIKLNHSSNIDLLIINDITYPIKEIKNKIDKNITTLECLNMLKGYPEEDMVKHFGNLIEPCQKRVLKQYNTFKPNLSKHSIVLLEGNDYPGGSQTLLARRQLESDGYICLLNLKQSVWVRR